jgi:ketosteroid isomerase-like protein
MLESAPAPVATLLEAANANDTEAFLAKFAHGAVVDDWGREFAGTDAIREWSDREFIGKHVSLKIDAIQQQGDLTVVTARVGGDGFVRSAGTRTTATPPGAVGGTAGEPLATEDETSRPPVGLVDDSSASRNGTR